jgi:hypothetical protein
MTHTHLLLLLFAIGIAGCEKAQSASAPAKPGKEQPTTTAQQRPEKPLSIRLGKETVPSVARTPDMPAYHWPADFKLPLIINIESPPVPKEIQGPSPPIEEDKK